MTTPSRHRHIIFTLLSGLLVVALLGPGAVLAKPGNGNSSGKGGAKHITAAPADTSVGNAAKSADKTARKAAKAAAKAEAKAAKAAAKAAKTEAKQTRRQARVAETAVESVESSEPTEAVESSETSAAAPGIKNAFSRITSNLEKSLAKIADGRKRQLPPGLVRVWQKFASWLGVDFSTQPGYVAPLPPSAEPTPTVEPTSTATPTVEPTSTMAPVLAVPADTLPQ